MSSGVQVRPECLEEFDLMKRGKYQYLIFKISADKKFIEIESKGDLDDSFAEFCSKLPGGDCRYAVLNVEIVTKSGTTSSNIIFLTWSDDNASVKPKMMYAASKDNLKKAFPIGEEYQATERADLDENEIKRKAGSV